MKDSEIVGAALAEVLPQTGRYWFQEPHLLRLNLILLIPLLSSSVSGYDGSLMNGLQSLEQWKDYFGQPAGVTLGLVNAAQSIGSVLAIPFIGDLSDRFGRKPILLAGAILASWSTYGTQTYESEWSWRIPSIIQAALPLVQLCFIKWVPESPRWLIAQGREYEAANTLLRYHAGQALAGEEPTPLVTRELSEIAQTIQQEREAETTGWGALLATPGNRKRTAIVICVGMFAQWNGIGVVSYYLTLVLNTVGITSTYDQTLINGLLQIFNFGAALSAAFLVDRLGRRTLFLWSCIGMLGSYIVWTACSAVNADTGSSAAGIVVVVCLFVYYFHYDIAWTPLLFGYTTEILPYSIRGKGIAVELFSIYGSLIIAAFCNPIGIEDIGWKYYIVFCCLLALFLPVVYLFFPETKGRSLEEIAVIFDGEQALDIERVKGSDTKGTVAQVEVV
ncbi:hypothetical protein KJ359_008053 [Pestalotiopsis sp. 9143b]|nr:hypothetical protein KJ359_008053 [Pestalotiopsis sp. 9143b]